MSLILGAIAVALLGLGGASAVAASNSMMPQWLSGGHDLSNTRSQPNETTLTPKKVQKLQPRWTLDLAGDVSATAAVVDGYVYVPDWGGNLSKIKASSGQVIWQRPISDYNQIAGSVSRTDPAVDGNTVVIGDQSGAHVIAVDAATGDGLWTTQVDSHPLAVITSSPVIYNGVVYVGVSSVEEGAATNPDYPCCTFRGSVVALDEATGQPLWKTYTVPDNGGSPGGYSGGAVWGSTPVIDPQTHSIYVGTGNNYTVPDDVQTCEENAQANGTSDANCTDPLDLFDAVLSLDLTTGHINWAHKVEGFDAWTVACLGLPAGVTWCPSPEGPDYDFGGAGPNLFTTTNPTTGQAETLLGVGQKSGLYWAFDPATGATVWNTLVGPGSALGGIQWGTATDGSRIYVANANFGHVAFTLGGNGAEAGQSCSAGSWAALDPATGQILWQVCDPQGAIDTGAVSVAAGVVYAGSMAGSGSNMYALDAATGETLWSFASGGSVQAGPAIVGGSVYWGSGYSHLGLGAPSKKLYAFGVPGSS